jgi:hypothetical protein
LRLPAAHRTLAGVPDESDPPRKFYGLKPKEFERVNEAPAAAAGPDLRADPGITAAKGGPIDVRELARQATGNKPLLDGTNQAANRDNDVHVVLRENLARANAAGLNTLTPKKKRPSRRRRDYWLVLMPVNAFFAFCAFGPYANPTTFVYGLGGMAFFSAGFTWVMFAVMDDY